MQAGSPGSRMISALARLAVTAVSAEEPSATQILVLGLLADCQPWNLPTFCLVASSAFWVREIGPAYSATSRRFKVRLALATMSNLSACSPAMMVLQES